MKTPKEETRWYFVDESGDPVFFNRWGENIIGREGCSPVLILGYIETTEPRSIRQALGTLRREIMADDYLVSVPSLQKTKVAFHAKDDCPEVRQAVYKLLRTLDFRAQFVVARKREKTFRRTFKGDPNRFYDHLVSQLFKNVLHRSADNRVYFAKRGDRPRQAPLRRAIQEGVDAFQQRWKTKVATRVMVQSQTPSDEPCLQIVDYMNWAVYRAYTRNEMRFFDYVAEKVELVYDLYDTANYPNNFYTREKNPFDAQKISPL